MGCYQEFQAWRIFWVLWTQLESRRRKSDTTDWQCIGWKKGSPTRYEFFQDEIYWDEFRWYLHHNSQVSNYSASILDLLPHLGGKSQAAGLKDVNFTETAFWRTVRTGLLQALGFHHSRKMGFTLYLGCGEEQPWMEKKGRSEKTEDSTFKTWVWKWWNHQELGFDWVGCVWFWVYPQNRYFDGVWFRPIRVTTGFPGFPLRLDPVKRCETAI